MQYSGLIMEQRQSSVSGDPTPFEVHNPSASARLLLVCDHASAKVPEEFGLLGLDPTLFHRHIAWDIGAADLTRRLADFLDATAVLTCYSRLLIDANRPPDNPTLIADVSDRIEIPGNRDVSAQDVQSRIDSYHAPYHQAINAALADIETRRGVPGILAIHSFTPIMNGYERPWHVGLLWNSDRRLLEPLQTAMATDSTVVVGDNEPYSGKTTNYSMDVHGTERGLPNLSIEVRQDLIDTHHGAEKWAYWLADKIRPVLSQDGLYTVLAETEG